MSLTTRFLAGLFLLAFAAIVPAQDPRDPDSPPLDSTSDRSPDAVQTKPPAPPMAPSDGAEKGVMPMWRRVHAALEEETQIDVTETPLPDVAKHFEALHRIAIRIDSPSLEQEGMGADVLVSRNFSKFSFQAALDLIMRDLGLAYVVERDCLLITTKTKAKDRRIEAALEQPTEVDFVEVPLREVLEFLEDLHKIRIEFDTAALSEGGLGAGDPPITCTVDGIMLSSLLDLILNELELTYIVENDVLLITTPEIAESRPIVKLYPVGVVLDANWDIESLRRVVKRHTAAESELLGRHLAIVQSQPRHRLTAVFMRELVAAAQSNE